MSQVTDNVATIHHTVETVEKITAELLNELFALAISSDSSGITVYLPRSAEGGSISLTIREAFFEPKAPASEKGYGPGLGTMGDRLTDDNASNDPTHDDFRNPDFMGVPPDTGEQFAADLEARWHSGNTWLPEMAENFDSIATHVTDAADGNIEKGFTRQMVSRGVGMVEGTGSLYPMWCSLRDEYMTILKNSSENLTAVGTTLIAAAQSYAAQDEETAERLRTLFDGDLPWE